MKDATTPIMKSEGFDGQHLIVFPQAIQCALAVAPLSRALYITHIGYFPKATNHRVYRRRPLDEFIFICCHKGSGWCQLGEGLMDIQKGECFLIPANSPHRYGSHPGQSWEVSWIHFAGSAAPDIAEALSRGSYGSSIRLGDCADGFTVFSDIIGLLERGLSIDSCTHASMRIWYYFSELIRHSNCRQPESNTAVAEAIDFMHDHLEDALTLKEISETVKISVPYLCRIFKEQTGQSPMDYFSRLKIQRACKFLDLTDLKVRQIAERLGFEDPYYFSRMFKRIMQDSPAQYRQKSKE